jgi:hypothetical protein
MDETLLPDSQAPQEGNFMIRRHLSFANAISMIALFVALGGTSYALAKNSIGAKEIKKNAVGASEIKKNAVRAAEVKANAVGASEIRSNAVAGGDVADGTLGSGDLGDNSVGTGELSDGSVGNGDLADNSVNGAKVADNSLTANDIDDASVPIQAGPDAFARVQADGSLQPNVATFPAQSKGVDGTDVVKGEGAAATGTYCFGSLSAPKLASAVVALDNADAAAADRNLVASVAIDRGEDLGDCPATHNQARVRIVDGNTAAAQNARFFIWFEF